MAKRSSSGSNIFRTLSAITVVCLFSTCASSTTDAPENPELLSGTTEASSEFQEPVAQEEAPVQDEGTPATEVADADAFSALQDGQAAASAEAAPAAMEADGPYYNAVGGETLRRVAFTLYSDRKFAQKLLERNPALSGVEKLSADQRVYFDIETSRPEPRFLTKDLIDRYPEQLAERITATTTEQGISRSTATVGKGETLQAVSQRLYGTTRYWTELYLVNRDKIRDYNKVYAGVTLNVFNRPHVPGVAKAESGAAAGPVAANEAEPQFEENEAALPEEPKVVAEAPAPAEEAAPALPPMAELPPEPALPASPEPAAVQAPAMMDPLPETPPVAEAPKPLPPPPAPLPMVKSDPTVEEISSSDTNLRRMIYVGLILLIGAVAFYFTRSKRPKVDMLDMTADSTARPKLGSKDSQKKSS